MRSQVDNVIETKGALILGAGVAGLFIALKMAPFPCVVLAHPECPPEVIAEADFAGSTAGMSDYVTARRPKRVVMVTECSMSDNLAAEHPEVDFVRPCNLCPHMKRITLPKILHSLETMTVEVAVDQMIAARARKSVERMLAVRPKARVAA